jgi:hypothetical protein
MNIQPVARPARGPRPTVTYPITAPADGTCLPRAENTAANRPDNPSRASQARIEAGPASVAAAVPDLAGYEQLLLGQILTIPSVVEAQSTFAIRTILSRGPQPLDHWRGQLGH